MARLNGNSVSDSVPNSFSTARSGFWWDWDSVLPTAICWRFGAENREAYSTPVNLTVINGKQFLVAPRGRTQWVRNAEATGEITLKRGSSRKEFSLAGN